MGGLNTYSGLTTKIRAMKSRLLTDEDFKEFVELESVADAVAYLKRLPDYEPFFAGTEEQELHRSKIERILRQSIYHNYTKLYNFGNISQRKFLSAYFMRYEILFMKIYLSHIFEDRENLLDLSEFQDFFSKHSKIDLKRLAAVSSPEEFVSALQNTEYYQPLSVLLNVSEPTLFDYEMALDLYNFRKLWKKKEKILEKDEIKNIEKILGSKFDMLNIQWIYRSKKYYHMSSSQIYALMIPVNYRLSKAQIRQMVEAANVSELEHLIESCYYGMQYQNFREESLEEAYAEIMKHILSAESRKNPYSVSTVYSYLYNKEHEVDRLIIGLECIRYQIPAEEALQHLNSR